MQYKPVKSWREHAERVAIYSGPILWLSLTGLILYAQLYGGWKVGLNFNAVGEGPLETIVFPLTFLYTWLGVRHWKQQKY